MKKIIDNKVYDTTTAKKCGDWSNDLGVRDFSRTAETLYRKKTGEFFLFGAGGPATKYAAPMGHGWTSGEKIIPLTYDEAREWAEDRLDTGEYEKIFGEVVDDDGKQLISLYIGSASAAKLKRIAAQRGISQSALVEELIETM